jgi:hypothetical protein
LRPQCCIQRDPGGRSLRAHKPSAEFDIGANLLTLDRVIPEDVDGYPVNYGFVPQTISYDGDPFDALALGPALPGGTLVDGVVVGVLLMEDEKGSPGPASSIHPRRPPAPLTDTRRGGRTCGRDV